MEDQIIWKHPKIEKLLIRRSYGGWSLEYDETEISHKNWPKETDDPEKWARAQVNSKLKSYTKWVDKMNNQLYGIEQKLYSLMEASFYLKKIESI